MRIHTNINNLSFVNPVVAVGTFDGVHRGHQYVINAVKARAKEVSGESVIVTFNPHPRVFLNSGTFSYKILNTHLDKVDRFYKSGLDHLVVLPFDHEISRLSGEEFIEQVLVQQTGMKHLVLGYDNRFGTNGLHNDRVIKHLGKKHGFTFERLSSLTYKGELVSSSLIRDRLGTGNVRQANDLLGYEYSVFGRVTYGNQIGKKIGFPTANIEIKDGHKMLPCNGVYVVRVNWNGNIYFGMCNIGVRPTINKSSFSIEVHLFDFAHDIYNDYLTLFFLERIRDEKRFGGLSGLTEQLFKDKKFAQKYITSYAQTH